MIKFRKHLLFFLLLVAPIASHAQVPGCTDPLATNFNAVATQNDGSCIYPAANVTPVTSLPLPSGITESSGLIFADQVLWTHNDNTDLNLYSIDTLTGSVLISHAVSGVSNTDWEEISHDSAYVYIGDFGNNANGNRTSLRILRVSKSSLQAGAPVADTIAFSYSEQTVFTPAGANNTDFDCESMIVAGDSIYLFTKKWLDNKSDLYVMPKAPGTYTAQLRGTLDVAGLVTGATYMPDLKMIVLCGYSELVQPFIYLLYDFQGADFLGGNKRKVTVNLPFHQIEGIASENGRKFFLSNELFVQAPIINVPQKLHVFDLSSLTGGYIDTLSSLSETSTSAEVSVIYPNPAQRMLTVVTKQYLVSYSILDVSGKVMAEGVLSEKENQIDVSQLAKGVYIISVGARSGIRFIME